MARYSRMETLAAMKTIGVIPVFYNGDAEVCKQITAACCKGGARVLEFTNRGDRAIDVFTRMAAWRDRELPEAVLGVGSVCDPVTAGQYINAGADFVVGPLLDEETAKVCNRRKIPYCPGCGSVTEIHQAHLLGVEICKVFPGGQVGGPAFVKSVRGPCPWADLMPTGGVSPDEKNLREWFEAGVVCVGMGSKLLTKELIGVGDFEGIVGNVSQVLATVREIRRK